MLGLQLFLNNALLAQVVWSPCDAETCAVVTQDDQLLLGHLGRDLEPVEGVKHAACVAWSPDGCCLAYGWGDQVHVHNTTKSIESWSIQIASQELQVWH